MVNKTLFFVLCICLGCSSVPEDYKMVLDKAGVNQTELLKVIAHYDSLGQPEKRDAAYYLIGAMDNKYFWSGEVVTNFDAIFLYTDSLLRNNFKITSTSPLVKNKWEELVDLHGFPTQRMAEKNFDHKYYKADWMIAHIDQAFQIRDSIPWAWNMSREEFYEYILPYRLGTERPEVWNRRIYKRFRGFRDTTSAKNRMEATKALHARIVRRNRLNLTFNSYPFDVPYSLMAKGRRGACKHLAYYMAMVMRANGLPVTVDYTPLWGSRNGGHYWCVLQLEDGTSFPFETEHNNPFGDLERTNYTLAKVYRKTFKLQDIPVEDLYRDVPPELFDREHVDVTHEYTTTHNIVTDIQYPLGKEKKRAVICTFDNKTWRAQSWGRVKNGKAYFDNMGANVVYIAMWYEDGELYPATDPFLLEKSGEIKYIRTSGQQDMRLVRKYPRYPRVKGFEKLLLGGRVQGANREDFSDAVDFFTITELSDKIEEVELSMSDRFRFVRVLMGEKKMLGIGELMFYDEGKGKIPLTGRVIGYPDVSEEEHGNPLSHAFDGDLGTYFMASGSFEENWVGLDLGERKRIAKVRYVPRSDTNFIFAGDSYELCIWDRDTWKSLGKQVAADQYLLYKQVPANGLYLLHNHTRGREERIFTYENGKQVWW